MVVRLWTELATVKVRPQQVPPAGPLPTSATVKAASREGVALQVLLWSDAEVTGVTPSLSTFSSRSGAAMPADAVRLYRVGFIDIQNPSDGHGDPLNVKGEWPDPLWPIGTVDQPRNGSPFTLFPQRCQPVWIDIRVPHDTPPGRYNTKFQVTDGNGTILGSLHIDLTVWNFELPATPKLPTTYGFSTATAVVKHPGADPYDLADRYVEEALAHRVTLHVTDAYVAGSASDYDWRVWDRFAAPAGASPASYPVPWPPWRKDEFPKSVKLTDPRTWPKELADRAIKFWQHVAQRYTQKGWLSRSYFYTQDEPNDANLQKLAKTQSKKLHEGDPALRSLVTHAYDAALSGGNFDIWVPQVRFLQDDPPVPGQLNQEYITLQGQGKQVWWYDSNNSNFASHTGNFGQWPDEFIDHPGVNQLVHGPLTYRFGLEGYLYYNTVSAYHFEYPPNTEQYVSLDVWRDMFHLRFKTNGDGTLFYPGTPSEIGGTENIPVPSIRLQILRQSWAMYDMFRLLEERGQSGTAQQIAADLVRTTTDWETDPRKYETARERLAIALQGTLAPPV